MIKVPPCRKLKGYAFDPSLSLKMDTASINDLLYKVPWEKLDPGPVGEYVEVVDYDPTIDQFYTPVNLDDPYILAQDGLEPSESNPHFHQQMVYAVVMTTIKNFEKALGRKILWSPRRMDGQEYEKQVLKLRIYPHALREPNAYYSPLKKALLFGYFASNPADETLHMPDSLVFTCLSHDIIAHETTHAILDGIYGLYNEPTNVDMLAFHEAFADIVALFQHFTFPEVLKHQIAKTKGDLATETLLGQLAQEFGSAVGQYGSLRDAIGSKDKSGVWKLQKPSPDDYRNVTEPHARGSILVAAVFEAFVNIYKSRVADLIRIASEGTGILRQGELHPDLVGRLATEAAKAAGHVLRMCIRALDYCPPIDLTFGDYLRGIITADADLVADDNRDYRLAFIEAFRRRGIYPQDIKTLSVESLRHTVLNLGYKHGEKDDPSKKDDSLDDNTIEMLGLINTELRNYAELVKYENSREEIFKKTRQYIGGVSIADPPGTTRRKTKQPAIVADTKKEIPGLHERLNKKFAISKDFARLTGLAFVGNSDAAGVKISKKYSLPSFEVTNLRLISRVGPDGNQINQVVFSILQRSGIVFKKGEFAGHFDLNAPRPKDKKGNPKPLPDGHFEMRGACTLIFDLDTLKLKYAISKPLLDVEALEKENKVKVNMKRVQTQYDFQYGEDSETGNEFAAYFSNGMHTTGEPFAFLHQH
ncbi:MAG: hypothetical protein JNM88_03950 [Chitinophagaceae bacterium]|nr:hypothetical protein [Chitinophagaceae bacterium]